MEQSRYSSSLREIIHLTKSEAARLGHEYILPEHFLCGILSHGNNMALQILKDSNVDIGTLLKRLFELLHKGNSIESLLLPSHDAKRVLEEAHHAALNLKHDWIGSEHLLVGLIGVHETVPHRLLTEFGLTKIKVKLAMMKYIDLDADEKARLEAAKSIRTSAPVSEKSQELNLLNAIRNKRKKLHGKIQAADSVLCLIDVQERFAQHICEWDKMIANATVLIQAAKLLELPIFLTEQYPKGLGRTVAEINAHLEALKPSEKTAFSCFGSAEFATKLDQSNRGTIVLCGIETHVCVLQTALDGLDETYRIVVAIDATSSRTEVNKNLAIERLRQAGATIASVEMIVLEWLGDASHPQFKAVQALIK